MANKLERIKENKVTLIFLIIVFIYYLFFHSTMDVIFGDDPYFQSVLNNQSLIDWLVVRYKTWSSRLIIEGLLVMLINLPLIVWMILDSLMFVLIYYSIIKLTDTQGNLIINLLLLILMFFMPISIFGSAGWRATTLNYLWPLSFGFYGLAKMKDIYNGKPSLHIIYVISLLIGASQEQMCALLIGFCLLFNLIYYKQHKKVNIALLLTLLALIGILIFIITCPGNVVRRQKEIKNWYPSFANFGIEKQLVLGVFSTVSFFIKNIIASIVIFFILLIALSYKKNKSKNIIIASIPMLGYAFLKLSLTEGMENPIGIAISFFLKTFDDFQICKSIGFIIYLFILFIMLICVLMTLYKSLDLKKFIISITLIAAAFLSRVIMGFSPTIFASAERTFVFMCYLFILIDILLVKEILN